MGMVLVAMHRLGKGIAMDKHQQIKPIAQFRLGQSPMSPTI
jgi:hypothetical protein